MQIKPNQFSSQLEKQPLPPVVLLFGDEPQQKLDVIDALRSKAKSEGFEERQTLTADADFEWSQLIEATQTMSLFSDKTYIELTLPTGKPGTQGAKVLSEVVQSLNDSQSADTLLLIQGPKIGKDVQNAKWFKSVSSAAWFCHCYELQGNQAQQWIQQRAQQKGLKLSVGASALLVELSEGNLLAANQELEKLMLRYDESQLIDEEKISQATVDQSRFTVFQFTDEVLGGNVQRAVKILYRLESEGIEPNIVLWSLVKEAQLLEQCWSYRARNEQIPFTKMRIWASKQSLYNSALMRLDAPRIRILIQHLQDADTMLKSQAIEKPFVLLSHLALLFLPADLEHFSLIA
ncbi:DNA polymerase III subunit delta [Ningiella sp. W23]|uniref:DNA polymerase III subunit delta n=1 Tax=Ningiella sp. W23 TaxID=3023715 RepID=UPI003756AB26